MKSVSEVHTQLQDVFTKLQSGKLDIKVGEALHNNVGKQIGLINLQLKYAEIRKDDKPEIEFLK